MDLLTGRGMILQALDKSLSGYYESGLWQCHTSPSGAHHWLINGSGTGQCKYCGERRQFANSGVPDYGDGADREWYSVTLSKECLGELLPIA